MRFVSGVTDQYIYFFAADSSDLITPETGLATWTVRRSRNGGASAAYTTPTINETDVTNMPGWYELLLDEDMTLDAGDQSQAVALHITHAGMAPARLQFELYRPSVTAGETLNVSSGALNAISDGLLVAAKFGADFITAAKIAADVGTEIATAVWASATRLLTAGTNIVLAKGTGVTGFNDLDAAGVRAAVGLASANLDTQIGDLPTVAEFNARTLVAASYATATDLATVDTVVDAIKAKTDNLPTDPADQSLIIAATDAILTLVNDVPTNAELATALAGADDATLAAIAALSIPTAAAIADAVHDEAVDGATTFRQSTRLQNAALAGKASGMATTTAVFRDLADSKDRITATVDADGNRTAVTLDAT